MSTSWEFAIARALRAAVYYRQRYYVRGYRDPVGQWRYGVYAEPNPPFPERTVIGIAVSPRGKLVVHPTPTPPNSVH